MAIEFIVLPVCFTLAIYDSLKGITEYRVFKTLTDSTDRQKTYRLWLLRSLACFGIGALGALALIGQLRSVAVVPAAFAAALPGIAQSDAGGNDFSGMLSGFAMGLLLGAFLLVFLIIAKKRKAASVDAPELHQSSPAIGDIEALIPRNRAERGWAALLAINAGVSEELFYRLLLPLLLYAVTGNALVAFAIAAVLFGLAHCYQGWKGVLMTTLLGVVFTALYVAISRLWVVMALHALIDLNALLLQPLIFRRFKPAAL